MNELTAQDVVRLEGEVGSPRLSLFLPLPPPTRRARLRLAARNALLRADRALHAATLPGSAGALLGLVEQALHRPRAVRPGHLGLALFAGPSGVRQFHVRVRVPTLAFVSDRFVVTPVRAAVRPPIPAPGRLERPGQLERTDQLERTP